MNRLSVIKRQYGKGDDVWGWPFGSTSIWLDVDTHDPFRAATTQLAHELGTRARFTVWPGTHTTNYVQRHLPQTLRWYAAALAACKSGRPGDAED